MSLQFVFDLRIGIKACALMIPLLGVTWLFGLLSPVQKAFAYIFTILNSTQVSVREVGDARAVELQSRSDIKPN